MQIYAFHGRAICDTDGPIMIRCIRIEIAIQDATWGLELSHQTKDCIPRRDFVQLISCLAVMSGVIRSSRSFAVTGRPTDQEVRAMIDERLAENVDADAFVAVLQTNSNITRRQPNAAAAYRAGLQDPSTLEFFNQRRIKALMRLRDADLDASKKLAMLDLQLEKVDHSVAMCMDHFIGVYELLRGWGHPDEIAWTGLFHAIYGTEANVIDLLDYRSDADRSRMRRVVGPTTERWIALYGLMEACDFVVGTRDYGRPVSELRFFENANSISNRISDHDFIALSEVQVANAYEPFVASGQEADLGIARKFTLMRPFVSRGAQAALDRVLLAYPSNSDADVGCVASH